MLPAYAVHLLTASGSVFGVLALHSTAQGHYKQAFILIGVSILVDAFDGILARWADVKQYAKGIDGAMMDNVIDFLTYSAFPAFFLLQTNLLAPEWKIPAAAVVMLASSFQFSNTNAKTKDHFFLGFPSYWNLVVFYLFLLQLQPQTNAFIILLLGVLSFIPIKFIYPSRTDFLFKNKLYNQLFFYFTIIWGLSAIHLLYTFPEYSAASLYVSEFFGLSYITLSLWKTWQATH